MEIVFGSIAGALLGLLGTMIIGVLTLRKDYKESGRIKEDTSDIKPRVQNIEENTKEAKVYNSWINLIKDDVKEITTSEFISNKDLVSGIKTIIKEHEYQEKLKQDYNYNLSYAKDQGKMIIDKLYEELANKDHMNYELSKENTHLKEQKKQLYYEVSNYKEIINNAKELLKEQNILLIIKENNDIELKKVSQNRNQDLSLER